MRIGKPLAIENVSQTLGKGSCPICTFLKNEQSALLRGGLPVAEIQDVCNFHCWALAAAAEMEVAAKIFLRVLQHRAENAAGDQVACSFCQRLSEAETHQLKELIAKLDSGLTLSWMRQQGMFCWNHGMRLVEAAPEHLKQSVNEILARAKVELEADLKSAVRRAAAGRHNNGGVLGHAAEFLTSQRGLGRD
jgi:hypothetical protein